MAGAIRGVSEQRGLLARYARDRNFLDQSEGLHGSSRVAAATGNLLVRRVTFDRLGGFEEGIRSAGDVDFCWRMHRAGWTLEQRPEALVEHHHREDLGSFLAMIARYGAGARWLNERHPGVAPRWPLLGRLVGAARDVGGLLARGRLEPAVFRAIDRLTASSLTTSATEPRTSFAERGPGGCAVRAPTYLARRGWRTSISPAPCCSGSGRSASPGSRSRSRAAAAGPSGCRPGFMKRGRIGRVYGWSDGRAAADRPHHVFAFTIPLVILHLPFGFGLEWSLEAELGQLAIFFALAVIWDYLWFVNNPAYTVRRFRRGNVWWFEVPWIWRFPLDTPGSGSRSRSPGSPRWRRVKPSR